MVALTTSHVPSDLQVMITASMQWVCGYAALFLLCQMARKWLKPPSCTHDLKWSRLEPFVCNCVPAGNVLSTRAC